MTSDSGKRQESPRASLAAHLEAESAEIVGAFAREMETLESPITRDPQLREQVLENGNQILSDVIASLRAGQVRLDENYKLLAREVGTTRAANALPARESLRAATVFFESALPVVFRHAGADRESHDTLRLALEALNRSINMRIREAATAYTGLLLNNIHQAHVNERHRIARELHDRVGNGLSIAHHQLELYHVDQDVEPVKAVGRVETAHRAVVESMDSLRAVTSDLRLEAPLKSLEKALVAYIETVRKGGVRLHLRVNGDETWAGPAVRDESFLIIREAVRNALAHAAPTMVLISVDVAPHELRATVEDTGRGFDRSEATGAGGTGLASMRERAALLGGALTVASQPDEGTHVELVVPLPGHREDAAKQE